MCQDLMGVMSGNRMLDEAHLSLSWLTAQFDNFANFPEDADEEDLRRYARAYILSLIGDMLFSDKFSSKVHLMYLPLLEDFDEVGTYS